jgi:hypothetical protein
VNWNWRQRRECVIEHLHSEAGSDGAGPNGNKAAEVSPDPVGNDFRAGNWIYFVQPLDVEHAVDEHNVTCV